MEWIDSARLLVASCRTHGTRLFAVDHHRSAAARQIAALPDEWFSSLISVPVFPRSSPDAGSPVIGLDGLTHRVRVLSVASTATATQPPESSSSSASALVMQETEFPAGVIEAQCLGYAHEDGLGGYDRKQILAGSCLSRTVAVIDSLTCLVSHSLHLSAPADIAAYSVAETVSCIVPDDGSVETAYLATDRGNIYLLDTRQPRAVHLVELDFPVLCLANCASSRFLFAGGHTDHLSLINVADRRDCRELAAPGSVFSATVAAAARSGETGSDSSSSGSRYVWFGGAFDGLIRVDPSSLGQERRALPDTSEFASTLRLKASPFPAGPVAALLDTGSVLLVE